MAQEDVSEENEDEQQQPLDDLDDGEGRTETWGNESAGDGESSTKDIEQKLDELIDVFSEYPSE